MLLLMDFLKLIVGYKHSFSAEFPSKLNQQLLYFINSKLKMKKGQEIPTSTKRYCCLYHFATGKQHKESSPCFNHVPLGIINPLPSNHSRQAKPIPKNMNITSHAYDINFHTHDLNEIQNKQSLPKRLVYPRVYVQQLKHKHNDENINTIAGFQAFLKGNQFQQIFELFKGFAKATQFTSQEELLKSIKTYAFKNSGSYNTAKSSTFNNQILFSHEQFMSYLTELGLQESLAQQLWKVAFNKSRFSQPNKQPNLKEKQVISMKAFAYNFKKFYLDQILSYKNCLSQSALRQRMIDLRLFLQPWFNKNIILKENYVGWKQIQFQICAELKRYQQEKIYVAMLNSIQMRNKIWLFMRTLAKIFYKDTDKKNVGLDVFNQKATQFIDKNRVSLEVFVEFVNHFENVLLIKGKSKDQKFKITDLVIQAKSTKFSSQLEEITRSLRGFFKYLYFFNKNPYLKLNHETLNLDCSNIVEVSFNQLLQYLNFKRKETNHVIQMVESICKQVNEVVDARPEISGHKKFLNQCNFVAESMLKMIRRCDFDVFYRLETARQMYQSGDIADLQKLKQLVQAKNNMDLSTRSQYWKKMFSFSAPIQQLTQSSKSQKTQAKDKNYIIALQQYHRLRDKLQGKLPSFEESKRNAQVEISKLKQQQNKYKAPLFNQNKSIRDGQQQVKLAESVLEVKHNCHTSAYCSLCDELCNTDVTSQLNKIDEMSSYLMDLLGFP